MPFDEMKNSKKSLIVPKNIEGKKTKIAKGEFFPVCFRSSRRRFYFGRGSEVSSMFWICSVQVEQMNKKISVLGVWSGEKKAPNCKSRAFFCFTKSAY